jgi:hypothetical protein
MANEQVFTKELNALITRYLNMGCDAQDIVDELIREANSVFGHYNLESILKRSPLPGIRLRSSPPRLPSGAVLVLGGGSPPLERPENHQRSRIRVGPAWRGFRQKNCNGSKNKKGPEFGRPFGARLRQRSRTACSSKGRLDSNGTPPCCAWQFWRRLSSRTCPSSCISNPSARVSSSRNGRSSCRRQQSKG